MGEEVYVDDLALALTRLPGARQILLVKVMIASQKQSLSSFVRRHFDRVTITACSTKDNDFHHIGRLLDLCSTLNVLDFNNNWAAWPPLHISTSPFLSSLSRLNVRELSLSLDSIFSIPGYTVHRGVIGMCQRWPLRKVTLFMPSTAGRDSPNDLFSYCQHMLTHVSVGVGPNGYQARPGKSSIPLCLQALVPC